MLSVTKKTEGLEIALFSGDDHPVSTNKNTYEILSPRMWDSDLSTGIIDYNIISSSQYLWPVLMSTSECSRDGQWHYYRGF